MALKESILANNNISASASSSSSNVKNTDVISKEMIDIDVPGDGSCLFWAVALNYLLPVATENTEFQERFEKLFDTKEDTLIEEVRTLLLNTPTNQLATTLYIETDTGQFAKLNTQKISVATKLNNLVKNVFRNKVVDYIRDNPARFITSVVESHIADNRGKFKKLEDYIRDSHPDKFKKLLEFIANTPDKFRESVELVENAWNDYLKKMQGNEWGGNFEIIAMREILNCIFNVEKIIGSTRSRIDELDYKEDEKNRENIEINLVNENEFHYNFLINEAYINKQNNNGTQVTQNKTLKKSLSTGNIPSSSSNIKNSQNLEEFNKNTSASSSNSSVSEPNQPKYDLFDLNFDDSSDEEDNNNKAIKYNFEDKLGSYYNNRILELGNRVTRQQIRHSFLLHAIGIKMLYAGDINETYYRLKSKFLSKNVDKIKSQLPNIIEDIIANIFLSLCGFLVNDVSTAQEVIKKYTDEIIKESKTFITQVVADRRILFDPNKAVSQENINNLIKILIEKFFSFKAEKYKNPEIKNLAQKYKSKLKDLAIACAIDELKKLNLIKLDGKCNNINNNRANINLNYNVVATKTDFPELVTKCNGYLVNSTDGRNMAYNSLNDTRFESYLAKLYLTDLAELYLTDLQNLSKNNLNYRKTIYNLESNLDLMFFFNETKLIEEAIKVNVSEQFFIQLDKKLADIKAIQRKTLGEFFEFTSNSKHDFISNLRLSNRSQTRAIKNFKHSHLLIKLEKTVYRNWRFNTADGTYKIALERQIISSTNKARQDEVEDVGSYKKIYKILENYKKSFSEIDPNFVTDANIATWINDIYMGRPLNKIDDTVYLIKHKADKIRLKEFLIGLTYLLMGCEVVRNPASLPIHQMMLDLIKNNKLTWKEALTNNDSESGGKMPMSAKGSIAVGRTLHNKFNQYMSHPYNYRGPESTNNQEISDMIVGESWILEQWLELNPISNETETLFQHLINSLAQIDLNKELPNSNVVTPSKVAEDYQTLAAKYEQSVNFGAGFRAKYISAEGGVSGIRGIFVDYYKDENWATYHSSEIRKVAIDIIRNKLRAIHNNNEIYWYKHVYCLLIIDFIKNLIGIVHFLEQSRRAKYSILKTELSLGNDFLFLITLRILAFTDSIALVV